MVDKVMSGYLMVDPIMLDSKDVQRYIAIISMVCRYTVIIVVGGQCMAKYNIMWLTRYSLCNLTLISRHGIMLPYLGIVKITLLIFDAAHQ